jgi:two-component system sensor kinase FixL
MGAMAATLAHELNQPLAAAHNWLTAARALLADVPDVPADALDALGEGRATIMRAGEIIRRMRKLVAGGSVTRSDEELGDIVEEAQSLLRDSEGDHDVVFEVDVPLLRVLVDRVQIQQVLLNLMRNALEAMRQSDERRIRVAARAGGATIEIVVSDTGTGLAEGFSDELFTPFRTTKSNGLGVGLSICRTIVEAHGGRIWLKSNPGCGTAVHFTVPRAVSIPLPVTGEGDAAYAA